MIAALMPQPMHINLFIQSRGHHEAAWRHPKSSPLPLTDIDYTVEMAQKAEAGLFLSVFLPDVLGLWNDVQTTPFNWLEPITTLASLAMVTKRIGLIATASTTYTEPYNLARQFCSLDHISRGRIGWNIVTTGAPHAPGNFGGTGGASPPRGRTFLKSSKRCRTPRWAATGYPCDSGGTIFRIWRWIRN